MRTLGTLILSLAFATLAQATIVPAPAGGGTIPTTTSILKGDNAGNAAAASASDINTVINSTVAPVFSNITSVDGDLTSLAAASGTNTLYYRSAANTWSAVTIGGNMSFSGGTLDSTASGTGDVAGPASSVDGELALFSLTTGKLLKRATGTGLLMITSGVASTAAASDVNSLINSTVAPVFANLTSKPSTAVGYGITGGANLDAIAGLTSAADTLAYFTGSGAATTTSFTSTARSLLDDTSVTNMRNTLGASSGLWPATIGGTGQSSFTKGDLLAASSSTALAKLAVGSDLKAVVANSAQTTGLDYSAATFPTKAGKVLVGDDNNLSGGTALTVGNHYYDTLSADRTLTFSGSPTAGGNATILRLNVTADSVLTFPSSVRVGGDTTPITSLTVPMGQQVFSWTYSNGAYLLTDTVSDVADLVPTSREVNGHPLNTDVDISGADLVMSDVTDNNVSTSAHGFAPKGDGSTSKYWGGDWTEHSLAPSATTDTTNAANISSGTLPDARLSTNVVQGGATSGSAPVAPDYVPCIAFKTGIDMKSTGPVAIFTVPTGRKFRAIAAQLRVTAVTGAAGNAFNFKIQESGAGTAMTANAAATTTTPAVDLTYSQNTPGNNSPYATCAAGNNVQLNITVAATSTTETGTGVVVGFYVP